LAKLQQSWVGSIPKLPIYNKRSLGENKVTTALLFLILKTNKTDGQRPKSLEIGLGNACAATRRAVATLTHKMSHRTQAPVRERLSKAPSGLMSYAWRVQAKIAFLKFTSDLPSNPHGFD
jgi:hypothetical protein